MRETSSVLRSILFLMVLTLVTSATFPAAAWAQAVQAIRNQAEEAEEQASVLEIEEALEAAEARVGTLEALSAHARREGDRRVATPLLADIAARLALANEELRAAEDDPEEFRKAARRFNDILAQGRAQFVLQSERLGLREDEFDVAIQRTGPIPVPGPHTLVKEVVWVMGAGGSFGEQSPSYDLGVSTNLLGSALSTAFGLLGSSDLTEYVKNNVSAGAGLPLASGGRITSSFGLGLGGVRIGRAKGARQVSLWPVLSVAQVDSADPRSPRGLREISPNQATWSSPTFSVGVMFFTNEEFAKRVKDGQTIPVISVGVGLPLYYPGDPAAALAGIFTSDRAKYQRAGGLQFLVSGSIPLLRLAPKP